MLSSHIWKNSLRPIYKIRKNQSIQNSLIRITKIVFHILLPNTNSKKHSLNKKLSRGPHRLFCTSFTLIFNILNIVESMVTETSILLDIWHKYRVTTCANIWKQFMVFYFNTIFLKPSRIIWDGVKRHRVFYKYSLRIGNYTHKVQFPSNV